VQREVFGYIKVCSSLDSRTKVNYNEEKTAEAEMSTYEKIRRAAEEFDEYYGGYDPDTDRLLTLLEETYTENDDKPSYLLKASLHEVFAENCRIKLFGCSPFFFEMSTGRPRGTWGGLQSRAGTFLDEKTAHLWLHPYSADVSEDNRNGYFWGWRPTGIDHHCLGYDRILTDGFLKIKEDAQQKMTESCEEQKNDFYTAVIRSIDALLLIEKRFADKALEMSEAADDPDEKAHYSRIADAAERVPQKPPRSFYEALCAIFFCREIISSIEGIGVSTFGQVDRMLYPYYEADVKAGKITREDAFELISMLLAYTDERFTMWTDHHETSTTMILGGCDADGNTVYNEVTRIILDAVREGRYIGTKINCRISSAHPREFFEKIAEIQLENLPVIVMENDDVIIPARVRQGQAAEDCRLYVSGGCHEVVLANTEVNTRADSWISLPRILLDTIKRSEAETFDAFYAEFICDASAYYDRIVRVKNQYEQYWGVSNPLPLYSATITGCLETGRDVTEGGAKYSSTALSMVGAATVIDSLYSIRHLVYEKKMLTLRELSEILASDYSSNEPLRQYIINKIPKYGTNSPEADGFAAKFLSDLSDAVDGRINARGGKYLPAFYPHDIFRPLGYSCGATPDGRHAGVPLSRGCSPSEFIDTDTPIDVIHSLGGIDFTKYSDSFCAEMTLPYMDKSYGVNVLCSIIEAFLEQGGSSLQFNLLDRKLLLEAQKHPEQHRDIVVRVCGYSEVFVLLDQHQQSEVLSRAVR